jgi:hypothetical protein
MYMQLPIKDHLWQPRCKLYQVSIVVTVFLVACNSCATGTEDSAAEIRRLGGLKPLVALLANKNADVQKYAAMAVGNCADDGVWFYFVRESRDLDCLLFLGTQRRVDSRFAI